MVMPKARKEHHCDLCREPIPAGTEYVAVHVTPSERVAIRGLD